MSDHSDAARLTRRRILGAAGALAVGGALAGGGLAWRHHERGKRAEVFIGKAQSYDTDLVGVLESALDALGVTRATLRGKRVLLKPNLVETALGQQHINTHPAVLVAAAEVFRRRDVASVIVAEGQGHRRDSLLVLEESGTQRAIREAGLEFVDLNHDDVRAVEMPAAGPTCTSSISRKPCSPATSSSRFPSSRRTTGLALPAR